MASPHKPWRAEYAKSSRSSCKTCKSAITKETFRLGKLVQASQFDGVMPMWNHASCILKKTKQIKSVDDVEGIESLRWEDQEKIRKYVESGAGNSTSASTSTSTSTSSTANNAKLEYGIEVSQTSRAGCRKCSEKILKGEVRIFSKPEGPGNKGLMWHHAKCFLEMSSSTELESLSGWRNIPDSDQEALLPLVKKTLPAAKTETAEARQTNPKAGTKRRNDSGDNEKSKLAKTSFDMTTSGALQPCSTERVMEAQTKELWDLKDDLKKYVTTAELREMLELNEQSTRGSELDLRDKCADGMMFGPLALCPICSGHLSFSGGLYRCHGYISEWSKCSHSTLDPDHIKGKWKIPEGTENQFLLKWNKSQKSVKPKRILRPVSSGETSQGQGSKDAADSSRSEKLSDLKVSIDGDTKERQAWKKKIEEAGAEFHANVKKGTSCLVVCGTTGIRDAEMRKARRMKVAIVREDYLVDCLIKQRKLPLDKYKIEDTSESLVTVKVKGRSAVHEASGLQEHCHILEDGNSIYNTTLSMSDLSTGINSYYILQIIQEDKGSDCYVFRKWGRVGNEKIGGNKVEEMSKSDAVHEFKRLFLEKTGNSWESWEQKTNFQKQPGKFLPLDIDYGVNKQVAKKEPVQTISNLAPPLIELMKMLFDVETYRSAMMEFEINMSEMPLGKLSKHNIQKGFEVLTEIQKLLTESYPQPSIKESLLVDASNRFFTMIPSIHPHIIRDEDDFKSKVKMLEALQDIEIASRLVGFDVDSTESLDDKYKKLHCDISPLPHDSEDYRLIEKYLNTTHAPTHTEWSLELEEVFALEREGEFDKYAPYREKLGNKMLLWHGSRLTNFVGILNQGLRIAPPEAPATGYMFGKGIYFADLVSKSAQYCYTCKKNPVGLMLLSEVALGEIHELTKATYMDKPPRGKHSTKGLGKKVPQDSEFAKWRGDVSVPCGKPVSSKVKASELMYNEYIVYNTAQVKLQYLLKVRFKHKR
ncbi:PREDICTED: poly [ADP-ribose] polymerase 1 [Camelina sativa]|uniref:Poly [ADP-ribose] polymerase n=1 Tax=Camelina sativa TaxID=90675 RepID=A0ABM0SP98_CAMSA|nr:PREDICTED: poly [ADP-ribose] polymerase 1 [Camelina sativa]